MQIRLFAREFSKKYPTMPYVQDDVRFEVIQEKHQDQVIDQISRAWHFAGPLENARNMSLEGVTAAWKILAPMFCKNGLSIAAIYVPTGELIGCHLIGDMADPEPEGPEVDKLLRDHPDWGLTFQLLEEMQHKLKEKYGIPLDELPERGQIMHWFGVAVDRKHIKRNISQGLQSQGHAQTIRHGFKTAYVEAVNDIARHTLLRDGFVIDAEWPYADYKIDGEAVFANAPKQHRAAYLMTKTYNTGDTSSDSSSSSDDESYEVITNAK